MEALTSLIQEDATQSMPPFELWLQRPRRHPHLVGGPGHRLPRLAGGSDRGRERLAGVRPVQAERAGGGSTRGRSRCSRSTDGRIVEFTFFLDTETLFPLFGLPPRLEA